MTTRLVSPLDSPVLNSPRHLLSVPLSLLSMPPGLLSVPCAPCSPGAPLLAAPLSGVVVPSLPGFILMVPLSSAPVAFPDALFSAFVPSGLSSSLADSPLSGPLSAAPAFSPGASSVCEISPFLPGRSINSGSYQSSLVCAYSTRHGFLSFSDEEDALLGIEQTSLFQGTPKRKGTQRDQVRGKRTQLNAWGYEVVAGKHVPFKTQQQASSDDNDQPSIRLLQSLNFQLPSFPGK
ncbi:hypothetical protein DSO57_1024582 [Entomophthora muscae]|uniref:Uncharacterized protein n=1 Tax=Entomophthora muscae TaxID=34485 RepID=A0ACC2TPT5_9FUNG|nr:hypothetical protein DSO57_1024582 [Entomophthora muscae]